VTEENMADDVGSKPWIKSVVFVNGLALAMYFAPADRVAAQGVAAAYVFSEDQTADDLSCQLDRKSIVAAVEAALRYGRVALVSEPQASSRSDVVRVYVNHVALAFSFGCVVSPSVEFYEFQPLRLPPPLPFLCSILT
jgi:ABC-type transport system involved in cytochrome c biogenesis permease subunit